MARKHSAPSVSFFAFQDIITSVVGIFVLITLIMVLEMVNKATTGRSSNKDVVDNLSSAAKMMDQEIQSAKQQVAELLRLASSPAAAAPVNSKARREELDLQLKQIEERKKLFESRHAKTTQAMVRAEGKWNELKNPSVENLKKTEELKDLLDKLSKLDTTFDELEDNKNVFRKSNLGGRSVVVIELGRSNFEVTKLRPTERLRFDEPSAFESLKNWIQTQKISAIHFFIIVRPGGCTAFNKCQGLLNGLGASYGYDASEENLSIKGSAQPGN